MMTQKGKLNMIHVLVFLHLVVYSSGCIQSAYFKKSELKSTSSKNKEPTSGVNVHGILECARRTLSTQQTGFYYDKKDKTCRLDIDGELGEASNDHEYWSRAPKQEEKKKTNDGRSAVLKWTSDGSCFTIVIPVNTTRRIADSSCTRLKGKLAVLFNKERFRAMAKFINIHYEDARPLWIGLSENGEDNAMWDNGQKLDGTINQWARDGSVFDGRCVVTKPQKNFAWAKLNCDTKLNFICEFDENMCDKRQT